MCRHWLVCGRNRRLPAFWTDVNLKLSGCRRDCRCKMADVDGMRTQNSGIWVLVGHYLPCVWLLREAQSADYVWCNCQICADTSDSVNSKHASLLNIRLSVSIYHHHWYFSSVLVKCNTHHSGGVSRLGVQPLTKWCMEDYVRPMCNFAISHN